MKYANLHLHSTYSDAQFTPSQLVLIGKALGYHALALTDHDTDGGCKEFIAAAIKERIDCVSGAEFYGVEDDVVLHLTALDFDMDNPKLRAFIKNRCDLRCEHTRRVFERAREDGLVGDITWNDVTDLHGDGAWLCVNSVINAMTIKRAVPVDFDWMKFRQNTFKTPFANEIKPPKPTAKEVIEIVRGADGIVGLAHPHGQMHFVEKLVGYGINAIEVSHPINYENTSFLAMEAAKKYNLYHIGGTDHTGPMGGNAGNFAIPVFHGITEEEFTTLKERRRG